MDASNNVSPKEFELCKSFMKSLYDGYEINQNGFRFGLIECGSDSNLAFSLTKHTTSQALDKAVDRTGVIGGNCLASKALSLAQNQLNVGARGGKPRVVVMLLAGKSSDHVEHVADELKKEGTRIIVLGVGNKVDLKQMEAIATSPLYALKVPKFEYLPFMTQTVKTFIDEGEMT